MIYVYSILGISADIALLAIMANVMALTRSRWQVVMVYLAYGILLLLMNTRGMPVTFKLPLCVIAIWIIFLYCYERTELGTKIGIAVSYMIVLCIPELLIVSVVMLLGPDTVQELTYDRGLWFICLLAAKLITYLMAALIIRIKNMEMSRFLRIFLRFGPMAVTFLLLVLMVFIMININVLNKRGMILILAVVAAAVLIYMLAYNGSFQIYFKLREKEDEVRVLEEKNQLQYRYYKEKMGIEEDMQKVHHDLKNSMLLLKKREVNTGELEKTIHHLTKNFKFHMDTGNEMLNIILAEKFRVAEELQIKIDSMIYFPEWCCLTDLEICTVFGNLLDNAIEASKKVEIPEKRYISIKMNLVEEHIFVINIKNYISDEKSIKRRGNTFFTSKLDGQFHGLGLRNVKEVVLRHDGCFDIRVLEDSFEVTIIFFKESMTSYAV